MKNFTLIRNKFGHVHLFYGNVKLDMSNICNYRAIKDNRESDKYYQSEEDMEWIKSIISTKAKNKLEKGYKVVVKIDTHLIGDSLTL